MEGGTAMKRVRLEILDDWIPGHIQGVVSADLEGESDRLPKTAELPVPDLAWCIGFANRPTTLQVPTTPLAPVT